MPKLRTLGPLIRHTDTRPVRLPPKQVDNFYNTPEFAAWRAAVIHRAEGRCETVDKYGNRCVKAKPKHRVYADHIVELRDGGVPLDLNNGQCLCASHHQIKTMAMRNRRLKGV